MQNKGEDHGYSTAVGGFRTCTDGEGGRFSWLIYHHLYRTKLRRYFLESVTSAVLILRVAVSLLEVLTIESAVSVQVAHQVSALLHEPSVKRRVTEVQTVIVFYELNPVIQNFMQDFQLTKLTECLCYNIHGLKLQARLRFLNYNEEA